MTRIIALSGHRGVGKDTVGAYLAREKGYTRISFAGPLKDMVSVMYGIPRHYMDDRVLKEMSLLQYPVIPTDDFSRKLQHQLRDELRGGYWTPRALCILEGTAKRAVYPSYWIKQVVDEMLESPDKKFVITDLRYKSEADTLKALIPGLIIARIENSSVQLTTEDPSERDMDDYQFTMRISNHGTIEDLERTVGWALKHVMNGY